jgi:hypothetical protein
MAKVVVEPSLTNPARIVSVSSEDPEPYRIAEMQLVVIALG